MIEIGNPELTAGIKNCWKRCFTNEDDRYTEYFFKYLYRPEWGYAAVEDGQVVSTLCRIPHSLMFNGRVLATSMIVGVATIPEARQRGYMHQLMDVALDACDHSELITLIQAYNPELYEPFDFHMIYNRSEYTLDRMSVKRQTSIGCVYDPSALDMLKCYSRFIRRFNGYYTRDLNDFVNYKKEVAAQGGKIVAYYNDESQIMGYCSILPNNREARVEELIYLDSAALNKLVNAAVQERNIVHLNVSDAENLGMLFPNAKREDSGSTMVRLNNPALFSRLFNTEVETVEEAFALSRKPLNLNEWM